MVEPMPVPSEVEREAIRLFHSMPFTKPDGLDEDVYRALNALGSALRRRGFSLERHHHNDCPVGCCRGCY